MKRTKPEDFPSQADSAMFNFGDFMRIDIRI